MIEFKTYQRIVEGDLRPNLPKFETDKGLEQLDREFFVFPFQYSPEKDIQESILESMNQSFWGFKEGDTLVVEIDDDAETKPGPVSIVVSVKERENEEELINIDIPPPNCKKTTLFLEIIQGEFERIKRVIKEQFEEIDSFKELDFFVSKNIQFAKNLGKGAHRLHKKYKLSSREEWDNPNSYVLYCLKKYIVYSIEFIQDLCYPLLGRKIQNSVEIIDELYDFYMTKMLSKVGEMDEQMNTMQRNNYWKELGANKTIIQQKEFFTNKIEELKITMEKERKSRYGIANYHYSTLNILENEYSKIFYAEQVNFLTDKKYNSVHEKFSDFLSLQTSINQNKNSEKYRYSKKSGFLDFLNLEIEKLEKIIKYSLEKYLKERVLLTDIVNLALMLQGRKYLQLTENQNNDCLVDLLRAKEYYITDETRQGRSGTENKTNYNSGELDIVIRDEQNSGKIISIIEALELSSCGEKNTSVPTHIDKLLTKYDTNGNEENYILIYAKAKNYNSLWSNYCQFVNSKIFKDSPIHELDNFSDKSDLKVGCNSYNREGKTLKLYHVFLNMSVK